MSNSEQRRVVVQQLLKPKAADFGVTGNAIGETDHGFALSNFRRSRRIPRYYALLPPCLSPQPGRS